jgi:nucleotide-binding universal stress UspA family protein
MKSAAQPMIRAAERSSDRSGGWQAGSVTTLLCTDGSRLALHAIQRALQVLRPDDRMVIATVVELTHPMDVLGTGLAPGLLTEEDAARADEALIAEGQQLLEDARTELNLPDAELMVRGGPPGPTLCDLAEALPASVMVLGTRGRSGLRRAFLGSVSDHVVRHAPCPVVVTAPEHTDA